jgi:hypothetical protein
MMNKAIVFPVSQITIPFYERIYDYFRRRCLSYQCQKITYNELMQKMVTVIDEILDAHSMKQRFHNFVSVELIIKTDHGLQLDVFKAPNENVIAMLYKKAHIGQDVYSVVFDQEENIIKGIDHMTVGFTTSFDFAEQDSKSLNPEVLVEFLVSRKKLMNGKLTYLDIKNEKKY